MCEIHLGFKDSIRKNHTSEADGQRAPQVCEGINKTTIDFSIGKRYIQVHEIRKLTTHHRSRAVGKVYLSLQACYLLLAGFNILHADSKGAGQPAHPSSLLSQRPWYSLPGRYFS